jgi:cell division protein FtsL
MEIKRKINLRYKNKKISIFQFLILIFLLAGIVVFYINNIIVVNQLISKNNELKDEINKAIQTNYSLKIEIEKLSSYERIKLLSAERFQLKTNGTFFDDKNIIIINKSQF